MPAKILAAKESGITEIEVPEVLTEWVVVGIELEGVTPLLMNNPALMRQVEHPKLGKKEIPAPDVEARSKLYRNPDGSLYVKADMVRQSMIVGASGLKINKKSARIILAASVMEVPSEMEFILHRNGKDLTDEDYSIDVRRCVVQRNGIMRARPRIELPWGVTARFLVDSSVVGKDARAVIQALSQAGQTAGLGDYRPSKGGSFGRFQVVRAWVEN